MHVGRFSWSASVPVRQTAGADVCREPFVLPDALRGRLPCPLVRLIEEEGGRVGRTPFEEIEEVRLRADNAVCFTVGGRNVPSGIRLTAGDVSSVLDCLCRGSLYAYEQEIRQGYLSLPDGIRVGVAGDAAAEGGRLLGVRHVTSLCIRLPHPHPGVGYGVARLLRERIESGSPAGVLIYGAPGVGKTTLLRSAASLLSSPPRALRTVLVDTRRELGTGHGGNGCCLDVLSGYPRALGVEIAVRTLNAQVIVCDEVGSAEDADALIAAHRGGVPLLCSAHAGDMRELWSRPGLRAMLEAGLFSCCVGIERDGCGGFLYRAVDTAVSMLPMPTV